MGNKDAHIDGFANKRVKIANVSWKKNDKRDKMAMLATPSLVIYGKHFRET